MNASVTFVGIFAVGISIIFIISLIVNSCITMDLVHSQKPKPVKGFLKSYAWYAKNLLIAFPRSKNDPDPFVEGSAINQDLWAYRCALVGFGLFPILIIAGVCFLIPFLLTTGAGMIILAFIGGLIGLVILAYFSLKLIVSISNGAEKINKVVDAVKEKTNGPTGEPSTE